jgi:hypothetical protein
MALTGQSKVSAKRLLTANNRKRPDSPFFLMVVWLIF